MAKNISLDELYIFQQEINARINLVFPTPLQSFTFYQTIFRNAKQMRKDFEAAPEQDNLTSWDDPRLLDMIREQAIEKGFLMP